MTWLAAAGWLGAALLAMKALAANRRVERAAFAEHELRGPVAALMLGIEHVRRGRSGPELADMLEAQLERSRAGLTDLVAALHGERGVRAPSRVSLEQLARHTGAGWAAVAAGRGRRLRVDWRAGPATVSADRGRLAQALGNLLANALEHGRGAVELRGHRVGGAIRIEVTDGGPGPETDRRGGVRPPLPKIGHSPRPGGRGHGLAIASRAIEESGGSLRVMPGRAGTTAVLELPLDER